MAPTFEWREVKLRAVSVDDVTPHRKWASDPRRKPCLRLTP